MRRLQGLCLLRSLSRIVESGNGEPFKTDRLYLPAGTVVVVRAKKHWVRHENSGSLADRKDLSTVATGGNHESQGERGQLQFGDILQLSQTDAEPVRYQLPSGQLVF